MRVCRYKGVFGRSVAGNYVHKLARGRFPNAIHDYDAVPAAAEAYRRMLVGAADHSIVICAIGFLTALRELLLSGPDATSPLNGTAPGLLTQCPQPLPAALSIVCSLPSCMPR